MLITFGSFSLHENIVWGVSSEVISTANSSSEQLKFKSQFTVFVFWSVFNTVSNGSALHFAATYPTFKLIDVPCTAHNN